MTFRITGLSPEPFRHLYGLPDEELRRMRARRYVVDTKPGFPDRIEVRDAEPGETVLLVNHTHQPADNPYRASHAIFVREGATSAHVAIDEVPEALRSRPLSLRAFDARGMIVDGILVDGPEMLAASARLLANTDVAYVHVHFARLGCYAARVDRLSVDD